jgi:hypothetical protein
VRRSSGKCEKEEEDEDLGLISRGRWIGAEDGKKNAVMQEESHFNIECWLLQVAGVGSCYTRVNAFGINSCRWVENCIHS